MSRQGGFLDRFSDEFVRALQNIRKDPSTPIILTFLGIILETATLYQTVAVSVDVLHTNTTVIPSYLQSSPSPLLILGALILYCIIGSLLLIPKRIVSPFWIQIGTISLLSLFILNTLSTEGIATTSTPFVNRLIFSLAFSFTFYMMLGVMMALFVGWIVGLNTKDVDRRTFTVKTGVQNIASILSRPSLYGKALRIRERTDGILVFESDFTTRQRIVIALGADPDHEELTILAAVACSKGLESISKDEIASATLDDILDIIARRLSTDLNPHSLDDKVSSRAQEVALYPSRSKPIEFVDFFQSISLLYRILIIITVALMVLLEIGEFYGLAIPDFISSELILFAFLVAEVLFPVSREYQKRRQLRNLPSV